jgi:uncharacterized membrane protein
MRFLQWIAIAAMTVCFPLSALAVDLGQSDLGSAGTSSGINIAGDEGNLMSLIGSIISVVLSILGALLLIYFIYAGFLWMTAQGDPKQLEKAKDIMKNALMGLIIVLVANSIVFFVVMELPNGALLWGDTGNDVSTVAETAGLAGSEWFLESNVGALINVALNILGVILLLLFLYAGFLWMTAQGDTKQTQKAKDMMRNAVVGLLIVLGSRLIASYVVEALAGSNGAFVSANEAPIHKG